MKILRIERKIVTEENIYTLITFKTSWGKESQETCISPKYKSNTFYAKDGDDIPVNLWATVKAFLYTEDLVHVY